MEPEPEFEPVVVAAVRTPVGKYGGILRSIRPDDLAALVLREAVHRAKLQPELISDVVLGCANQAGEDNRNVARMASIIAGLPISVPGVTVNRLCGSGLEAVNLAARAIRSGECSAVLAGGVESMTRAPLVALKPDRSFPRGGLRLVDTTIGWRFTNPSWPKEYPFYEMGETAENLADKYAIKREEQDEYSLKSHSKAIRATDHGIFREEIVPVRTLESPEGVTADEGPRRDTSIEKLARLPPAFRKEGTVTAGNSSQISDGAAALAVVSRRLADEMSLKPIARVLGSEVVGVDPSYMGLGPVPAVKRLLKRLGIGLDEFGVIELNEAFAAQVLACFREMPDLDTPKLNPHGGAVALGHPIGCSGARIATTLIHEMKRNGSRYGLAAMCIGVGQGIATAFELVS
ncbi:MAG: thiolase family protein [Nitrososphaerota archaeon]|nr:thiolase family protein [Nitrososphaerota archaeon]